MSENMITKEDLISAGAHFGHPASKWNPDYKQFIVAKKNGIHIIDVESTISYLNKATEELLKIVKSGGNILFVGTKAQARDSLLAAADNCGMFYIVERWLGGTLTNFATIKKSIKRLLTLEKESSNLYKNITKKEYVMLSREKIKLSDLHRGIKNMKRLPSALFIVDGIHEIIAIKEAKQLSIPTFGIIDSNTDPNSVDFPIPANDDSVKCIRLIMDYITQNLDYLNSKEDDSEDNSKNNTSEDSASDTSSSNPLENKDEVVKEKTE